MKKFSKESLQNFMLMHAEKLILGGCLAATGLFVWMSLGDDKGNTKTPSDLMRQANSADTYINRPAWESLEGFREGEAAAKDKIENAKPVNPDKYSLSLLGTPSLTLDARRDPEIIGPEQAIARRVTSGVMISSNLQSQLSNLLPAPSMGSSGRSSGSGGRDLEGGGGDFDAPSSSGLPADYPNIDRSNKFHDVNAATIAGIRPKAFDINPDNVTTAVSDVVCVVAVVDFQKQLTAFEKAFSESRAFNAKRDRPVYQFVQVQRREISEKETEWQDISEDVIYRYPAACPRSLLKMPLQIFASAPEVIAPENYDSITTGVIPAFATLDYQELASHPALKERRVFPDYVPPNKQQMMPRDGGIWGNQKRDDFSRDDSGDEFDSNELRKGSETGAYMEAVTQQKPGGQFRLVRFFDFTAPNNLSFEYRMRVWVGDPNQKDPLNGFLSNRGNRLRASEDGELSFAGDNGGNNLQTPEAGGNDRDDEIAQPVAEIKKTMLQPKVRNRLKAATDLDVMQERLLEAARTGQPLQEPFQVAELSKSGEFELIDLPPSPNNYAYIQYLRFARPSPWSEPVKIEATQQSPEVFAGPTRRGRVISMDAGAGEVEFELVEPQIEVVVSSWYGPLSAKLPSTKRVYVGETLNFDSPAFVTHPITWQILTAANPEVNSEELEKYLMPFRTGETIVDAFGGQQLELPFSKNQRIETPTEILTMDVNGKLKVSNQFDSATNYRNEITAPDSSRFYGTPKRKKSKDKDSDDDDF